MGGREPGRGRGAACSAWELEDGGIKGEGAGLGV